MGRTLVAALGTVALAGASLIGVATAAQAAPGTPGTPQANHVVFSEDFENGPGTAPQLLTAYTGVGGQKYTADPSWLTACNGIIVNFAIPYTTLGNCTAAGDSANLRQLAYALGVHGGAANPAANDVVAAYTENNPGAGAVEIQTVSNIPLAAASGRFLTFSVDTAAVNCGVSAPRYQFAFLDEGGQATNVGGELNACTSTSTATVPAIGPLPQRNINVGTYTSNGSVLFNGASLGIRMTNANGSGVGNDAAFDNIRILDVTPQLDKSFSPASLVAGEVSTLTLTVTNTADLAAKNGWSFTDALPAGLTIADGSAATSCPSSVVTAPSGGTTITASGNLSAGMASCAITVKVTSPVAGTFTNGPDNITSVGLDEPADATVEFVAQAPAIRVVKSATPTSEDDYTVGQAVTYYFVVTNTGNVALTDVSVDEGAFTGTGVLSPVTCPAGAENLAPSASVTCTATYTVTQEDVDAGELTNAATATGTPPQGPPPVSEESTVTIPSADPAPALTIDKSADVQTVQGAGDTITYSFLVTNTGNVTLNDVTVTEGAFSGTGALSAVTCPASAAALAPGADVTCTATYVVTQADVDAGTITNAATATGTPPNPQTPAPVSPSDDVTVQAEAHPAVTVVKSADDAAQADIVAGQQITYAFLVTNTGNVTLADVTVVEGDFSGAGALSAVTCPAAADSLAPGAQVTCFATYTVVQADVDAGTVTNSATATGTPPRGQAPVSTPSEVTVPSVPAPGLSVVKTASIDRATAVGQAITYSFAVTNTGNRTMTDVTIHEGAFTGTGTLSAVTCPAGAASLAPGAKITCTATYTVTQADVTAGAISNTATAAGTTPDGDPFTSDPSTVTVRASVTAPLATTGGANLLPVAGIALLVVIAGGVLLIVRRRAARDN